MNKWISTGIAVASAVVVFGGAATVFKEWRWITPVELQNELYLVASELEGKIGAAAIAKKIRDAEEDGRYYDQKVKSGMWHEPPQGTLSQKFWLKDQERFREKRQYYEQKARDLKK
jgi:hypothetical protein